MQRCATLAPLAPGQLIRIDHILDNTDNPLSVQQVTRVTSTVPEPGHTDVTAPHIWTPFAFGNVLYHITGRNEGSHIFPLILLMPAVAAIYQKENSIRVNRITSRRRDTRQPWDSARSRFIFGGRGATC